MTRPNPRRQNGHRRNELRARVLASETHCGICGQLVDKSLTFDWGKHGPRCKKPDCRGCVPHPLRPEVDEITPVSRGGDPLARANTRLAHRRHLQPTPRQQARPARRTPTTSHDRLRLVTQTRRDRRHDDQHHALTGRAVEHPGG